MRQLLRTIWGIIQDNFKVIYVNDDGPIKDKDGYTPYNWLWQLASHMPIIEFFQHTRDEEGEQFAPVTILRYLSPDMEQGTYIAPVSFTLQKDNAAIGFSFWGLFNFALVITWQSLRHQ